MYASEKVRPWLSGKLSLIEKRSALAAEHGFRAALMRYPHASPRLQPQTTVDAQVEVFTVFRGRVFLTGWAFDPVAPIRAVGLHRPGQAARYITPVNLPSPDVAARSGAAATRCRFDGSAVLLPREDLDGLELCVLQGDVWTSAPDVLRAALGRDRYAQLWENFVEMLSELDPGRLLEVGSRGKAGMVYMQRLRAGWDYVGFDVMAGPNVDVVGDAHELSTHLEADSVDAVMSVATFEHLAMPWKAACEIARVLKPGGLCCVVTHQTWPVHEQPWDFFRYSEFAWPSIFNASTGFEIVEAVMGHPARVIPDVINTVTKRMEESPGYLGTAVIARKVSEPTASWSATMADVTATTYPH